MIARKIFWMSVAVALTLPVSKLAFADGGGHDGGGSTQSGDDHGNNGGGDDHGGAAPSQANNGASNQTATGGGSQVTSAGDDHGANNGNDHGGNNGVNQNANNGAAQGANNAGSENNNANDDHGNDANGPASNANSAAPMNSLKVPLASTQSGASVEAEGHVSIRVQGQRERIQVEVEANVADGTTFQVLANGMPIGSITVRFGEGELELGDDNGAPLPSNLPASSVTMISVVDMNGDTVLQAQFGSVSSNQPSQPNAPTVDERKRADLMATPAGLMIDAHATVETRVQGQRQRFKIEVEADVPDNTEFRVLANGMGLGNLMIRFDEAEFELDENATLPAGLNSVSDIKTVAVVASDGTVVLQINF